MELPYNTTISKDLQNRTGQMTGSLADWGTKRRWVEQAFEALERAGYHIGSAYTATRDPSRARSPGRSNSVRTNCPARRGRPSRSFAPRCCTAWQTSQHRRQRM